MRTAAGRITLKNIVAVTDATFAVAKRKPEKIQACTRGLLNHSPFSQSSQQL